MSCRRATTAVEFAFIAPVLILLLLGTIEAGRAIWTKTTLEHAIADTVRWAYTNVWVEDAQADALAQQRRLIERFRERATGIDVPPGGISAEIEAPNCTAAAVTLGVTYRFQPVIREFLPWDSVELSASSSGPLQCYP